MGWLRDHVAENGEASNPGPRRHSKSPYSGPVVKLSAVGLPPSGPYGMALRSVKSSTAGAYMRGIYGFDYWIRVSVFTKDLTNLDFRGDDG